MKSLYKEDQDTTRLLGLSDSNDLIIHLKMYGFKIVLFVAKCLTFIFKAILLKLISTF